MKSISNPATSINMIDNLFANKHGIRLASVDDAFEIIGSGLPGMIFTVDDIDPSFFTLKNQILGNTFQKLINYHFPIAVVLPEDHAFGMRVTELAREHARHNTIRFCRTLEEAVIWMDNKINTCN